MSASWGPALRYRFANTAIKSRMAATAVPTIIRTSVGICGINFYSPSCNSVFGLQSIHSPISHMAIGHLVPSTDVGDAVFIASDDDFGAAGECGTVFAAGAAGLTGSFLREKNFSGATFADGADDAA